MARLPTVGGDSGDWGNVLNTFLQVSLTADGNLKLPYWADSSARPSAPETGQVGLNLSTKIIERYNGTSWVKMAGPGPSIVSPTYASAITINTDITDIVNLSLTGTTTITTTGTPVDGQMLYFRVTQDSTGYAITWGSMFAFGTDITTPLLPTSGSAKFELGFRWNNSDQKWRAVALIRGF